MKKIVSLPLMALLVFVFVGLGCDTDKKDDKSADGDLSEQQERLEVELEKESPELEPETEVAEEEVVDVKEYEEDEIEEGEAEIEEEKNEFEEEYEIIEEEEDEVACNCEITGNNTASDLCCDGCHILPDGTWCYGYIAADEIIYFCLEEGKCGGGYVSTYGVGPACYNGLCGGGIAYCPPDSKCKSGHSAYEPPCGLPCVPSEECGAVIDGDEDEEDCVGLW